MNTLLTKDNRETKLSKILITEDQIKAKVKELGQILNSWYDGKPLLLISILNGAFIFMADVCREVTVPCEIALIKASSYVGTNSTGNVEITMDLKQDLSNYNVVILEDIIDTGRTLSEVVKIFKSRKPYSLRVVTLLDKPSRRKVEFNADVALFTIPDYFVVGYGLDCDEIFRNLPFIGEFNTNA